jgi:uncharacterized membrane protein
VTFSRKQGRQELEGPSAWRHRIPVIALAILGCAVSTYLTFYQWHLLEQVWDPIFGSASSERVLSSFIDRLLPLPDATFGAPAYAVEAYLGLAGGSQRWRTYPGLVLVFGAMVVGMAVISLGLVAIQVFVLHAYCTLCLFSAAVSWTNAWLSRDEILAAVREWLRLQVPEPFRRAQRHPD